MYSFIHSESFPHKNICTGLKKDFHSAVKKKNIKFAGKWMEELFSRGEGYFFASIPYSHILSPLPFSLFLSCLK